MERVALASYGEDRWLPAKEGQDLRSAVDGSVVATLPAGGADVAALLVYARHQGGASLRAMTFQQRGLMLRALAEALTARKQELYELSYATGATLSDSMFDIDGGIGTLFVYAAKAKKLPEGRLLTEGEREALNKGDFLGQHVLTSRRGAGIHINAYNFPVWGMLEKLAPTLLAGVPAVVKPASVTAWLAYAAFKIMVESGVLPPGAVQLLLGDTGNLLDRLDGQDTLAFTGSAETSAKLRAHPAILREGVRFSAEQDSLNASILGADASADSPELELFVKEVAKEMTQKAGQKCTAIRRAFVPESLIEPVQQALVGRLARLPIGNPRDEAVRVGALAGLEQRKQVLDNLALLMAEAEIVAGGGEPLLIDADYGAGAFVTPTLLRCDEPDAAKAIHVVEAFGPVCTLMPYRDTDHAIRLAQAGKGSLAMSLFTHSMGVAEEVVLNVAASHGRVLVVDRDNASVSTGHGAAMPHLVHGGPGRAGGGEELGGLIGMKHYMQRTAIQGSASLLDKVGSL